MRHLNANVLRVLCSPLSCIERVAHLLLHLFLVSFDLLLYFGIHFEESVLVEAVDSLLNIQGAVPQHRLELRLLAKFTQNYLLIDVVCYGFLVLVRHEGFEILVLRQLHFVTVGLVSAPLLPHAFEAEQLRELFGLQEYSRASAID